MIRLVFSLSPIPCSLYIASFLILQALHPSFEHNFPCFTSDFLILMCGSSVPPEEAHPYCVELFAAYRSFSSHTDDMMGTKVTGILTEHITCLTYKRIHCRCSLRHWISWLFRRNMKPRKCYRWTVLKTWRKVCQVLRGSVWHHHL
jgi:hypothetical protein